MQTDKKEVKVCVESDRSHSQSRSSSSDKAGKHGGHYRRVGLVSMPPDHDTPDTTSGKSKADIARRISLDDLSAAFQGKLALSTSFKQAK